MEIVVSIGCIVMALELPPLNINAKEKKPLELHLNDYRGVVLGVQQIHTICIFTQSVKALATFRKCTPRVHM